MLVVGLQMKKFSMRCEREREKREDEGEINSLLCITRQNRNSSSLYFPPTRGQWEKDGQLQPLRNFIYVVESFRKNKFGD